MLIYAEVSNWVINESRRMSATGQVMREKQTLVGAALQVSSVPFPDIHACSPKKTRMPSGAPVCEPLRSVAVHSGRLTSAKFSI